MNYKVLIAVLTGAAAGFIIGTLVAPEKGIELRKKISDAAGNIADRLIDLFARNSENLLQPSVGDTSVNAEEILG
jgi:gas vesicle protein